MTCDGSELKDISPEKAIKIVAFILPILDHHMSCFRINHTGILFL